MSPEVSERSFEEAIECALLQRGPDACAGCATAVRETPPPWGDTPPGGYRKRRPEDYDRALCLLPRGVVDFVLATQPREWQKLAQHHGAAVKGQFLRGEPADAPAGPQGDGGHGFVHRAGHGTDGPDATLPARGGDPGTWRGSCDKL
ncbi:MAG: hypothetical protein HYS36_11730 [Candidatus Rokubacteria bacterium]|nr:hypothetical protein [Candidatus Rokubacteria bacterium]